MAYTKLFSSIVTSTIWSEDDKTRIVWITMLAIADKNGEVQASIPGLARVAGVSVADTEAAIEKFLSPDIYSRTPDDQGRRIEPIPGGWALLNHGKYRAMASKDEARTSNADRQRRHREKQRRNETVTDRNEIVTHHNGSVTQDRDIAEAEAEAEEKNIEESKDSSPSFLARSPSIDWTPAGGWQGISDDDKASWGEAYPACNLDRQLAAMTEWLRSNPAKAKKKQWRRFITGWLTRTQERGGDIPSTPKAPQAQSRRPTINDYDSPATWTEDQFSLTPSKP